MCESGVLTVSAEGVTLTVPHKALSVTYEDQKTNPDPVSSLRS